MHGTHKHSLYERIYNAKMMLELRYMIFTEIKV